MVVIIAAIIIVALWRLGNDATVNPAPAPTTTVPRAEVLTENKLHVLGQLSAGATSTAQAARKQEVLSSLHADEDMDESERMQVMQSLRSN